jgi:cysteine synthase
LNELKEQLKEQIKVFPESVKTGGVMTATLWKQRAEKATRLLAQPRASKIELETALMELRSFK